MDKLYSLEQVEKMAEYVKDGGVLNQLAATMHENQRLRQALIECTDWMEAVRASGDSGFWDWGDDAEYTRAMSALRSNKDTDNA